MDYLDSLDSSSKLAPICQKSFINKFYLILLNGKICFDVIGAKNSWWKQIHVFCIDNMYICIIRMGQASRAFLPQPAKSWKAWRKMCNIWQDKEDACVRSSSVAARLDQESRGRRPSEDEPSGCRSGSASSLSRCRPIVRCRAPSGSTATDLSAVGFC